MSRSGVTLLARLRGQDGAYVTQASISSISYGVRDLTAGSTTSSGTFTVSTSIFDSLQIDDRWTKDRTGYNFRATISAGAFDAFDVGTVDDVPEFRVDAHSYRVSVRFTPVTGAAFVVPYQFTPVPTWLS